MLDEGDWSVAAVLASPAVGEAGILDSQEVAGAGLACSVVEERTAESWWQRLSRRLGL